MKKKKLSDLSPFEQWMLENRKPKDIKLCIGSEGIKLLNILFEREYKLMFGNEQIHSTEVSNREQNIS